MPLSKLDLLEMLASGRDYRNGQRLLPDHVLNDPDVIRALHWAVQTLSEQSRAGKANKAVHENQGKAWSTEEDALLTQSYEKSLSIRNLAAPHGRSKGAITARLQKLHLLP